MIMKNFKHEIRLEYEYLKLSKHTEHIYYINCKFNKLYSLTL